MMGRYALLHEYLSEVKDKAFSWGEHDCCTFACGWVEKYTGKDYMQEYRGAYTSSLGAARLLKKEGGLPQLAEKVFGRSHPIAFASVGDVVCGDSGNGLALGVCVGETSFFVGPDGLVKLLTFDLERFWRLECLKQP
jgi:hypothetical protein